MTKTRLSSRETLSGCYGIATEPMSSIKMMTLAAQRFGKQFGGQHLETSRFGHTHILPVGSVLVGVVALLVCQPLLARHPVSVTVSYVYVTQEAVSVKMQIFLEDLYLFHNLQPTDSEFLDRAVIEQGIELHKQFIMDRFSIQTLAGDTLSGRVIRVEDEQLPLDGVPLSDLMAHKITYELEYELFSPPEFLTFSQRFTDEEGMLPSEMKLLVKQENGVETNEFVLRPDDLETVRFDWNLTPLSPEASAAERERWAVQQKEETLGITSYSSVYSFLYIEEYEVRHEILIPLLTLEQSVLIARDGDEMLSIAEQNRARQQIEAYFQTGNPVEINGTEVTGNVQRCDFYGLDFRDFAVMAERKDVPIVTARVGIILTYPCTRPPERVQLTWNRFNPFVWTVSTVVFAFDDIIKTSLSRLGDKSTFQWQGPARTPAPPPEPVRVTRATSSTWSLPVLSIMAVCAGVVGFLLLLRRQVGKRLCLAQLTFFLLVALLAWPYAQCTVAGPTSAPVELSPQEADAVFKTLHQNLYRAFDYRDESQIYDVLALSTAGDFLQQVYLQVRRGLEMAEQGGAVARVKEVSIIEGQLAGGTPSAGPEFQYRCRWNVAGTVEHWGHIHERINQYEANFRVADIDGVWKVTQLDLLNEERLQFETRLRGL